MTKPTVLLVEDDEFMRSVIAQGLETEGYAVSAAATAEEFTRLLAATHPDIVLIDLILPDGDGLSLMKEVRARLDVPVIIVSGRNELTDKVVGLELGADDYVGKPVQMREIAARVKAQLRRYRAMKAAGGAEKEKASKSRAERLSFGPWILDRPQMQVLGQNGAPLSLSVSEFRLLEALILSPNRVLSREQLLDRARADDYDVTDRAIDMQILRIRRKLGDKAGPDSLIRTVRGIGYMCTAETAAL